MPAPNPRVACWWQQVWEMVLPPTCGAGGRPAAGDGQPKQSAGGHGIDHVLAGAGEYDGQRHLPRRLASVIVRQLRGRLLWSMMTSWYRSSNIKQTSPELFADRPPIDRALPGYCKRQARHASWRELQSGPSPVGRSDVRCERRYPC